MLTFVTWLQLIQFISFLNFTVNSKSVYTNSQTCNALYVYPVTND